MVNIRDGIEDIETLYLLRDALHKLNVKFPRDHEELKSRAKEFLAVDDRIVQNMWIWSRDPAELLAYRQKLCSTLERIVGLLKE